MPRPDAIRGLKRDAPDERDRRYRADYLRMGRFAQRLRSALLPRAVDLRKDPNAPIFDQGNLGSCAAQSTCAALSHVVAHHQATPPEEFSRLFVYGCGRSPPWVEEDTGASLRDILKGIARHGAPLEALWPYDVSRWKERPPAEVWDAAAPRKAIE